MTNRALLSVASVFVIRLVAVGVVAAQDLALRPSLAIADIAITPGGWTLPPPQLSSTIVELMMGELVSSQRFQIYDGQWLVPTAAAGQANLAQLRGAAAQHNVDYLLLGTLTSFDTEQKKKRFGGLLPKPLVLGGFSREQTQLRVSISFRIVDVQTGEVVATASGGGMSVRPGTSFGGGGVVKGLPVGALVVAARSGSARDAMLNDAVKKAVRAAAQSLAAATLTRTQHPASGAHPALTPMPAAPSTHSREILPRECVGSSAATSTASSASRSTISSSCS